MKAKYNCKLSRSLLFHRGPYLTSVRCQCELRNFPQSYIWTFPRVQLCGGEVNRKSMQSL
jgi:hypothetical protein